VEVKAQAAERWVAAVNADGQHGRWRYSICRDMNLIPTILDEVAKAAAEQPSAGAVAVR
jgi:type III restriction enzyme